MGLGVRLPGEAAGLATYICITLSKLLKLPSVSFPQIKGR